MRINGAGTWATAAVVLVTAASAAGGMVGAAPTGAADGALDFLVRGLTAAGISWSEIPDTLVETTYDSTTGREARRVVPLAEALRAFAAAAPRETGGADPLNGAHHVAGDVWHRCVDVLSQRKPRPCYDWGVERDGWPGADQEPMLTVERDRRDLAAQWAAAGLGAFPLRSGDLHVVWGRYPFGEHSARPERAIDGAAVGDGAWHEDRALHGVAFGQVRVSVYSWDPTQPWSPNLAFGRITAQGEFLFCDGDAPDDACARAGSVHPLRFPVRVPLE